MVIIMNLYDKNARIGRLFSKNRTLYVMKYFFFFLIRINRKDGVAIFSPNTKEGKGVGNRPGNTLSYRFFFVIISSNQCIACFWIRFSFEACWKSLLGHGINTSSTESFYGRFLIELEIDDIKISPHFFHSVILFFGSNRSIHKNMFISIIFDKFL